MLFYSVKLSPAALRKMLAERVRKLAAPTRVPQETFWVRETMVAVPLPATSMERGARYSALVPNYYL